MHFYFLFFFQHISNKIYDILVSNIRCFALLLLYFIFMVSFIHIENLSSVKSNTLFTTWSIKLQDFNWPHEQTHMAVTWALFREDLCINK